MVNLADLIVDATRAAQERTEARIACTFVRAEMDSADVIYRPTWPSVEIVEHLAAIDELFEPAAGHPLDSMLALRDGLSVIEVFAPAEEEFDSTL